MVAYFPSFRHIIAMSNPLFLPITPHTNLIGKAGVGLAIFHFARLGFEANVTDFNSPSCDLWVRFPSGIEMVEVKTSIRDTWTLRGNQTSIARWIFFASLQSGAAWLLCGEKAAAMFAERGKPFVIPRRQLDGIADLSFHREGPEMVLTPEVVERIRESRKVGGKERRPKIIRKTLASGEVRTYTYAR